LLFGLHSLPIGFLYEFPLLGAYSSPLGVLNELHQAIKEKHLGIEKA